MGFAGGLQLDQWQVTAIFHLDHFFGVNARARHELESIGHVLETNFAVIGVNAFFHIFSISCASRVSPCVRQVQPLHKTRPQYKAVSYLSRKPVIIATVLVYASQVAARWGADWPVAVEFSRRDASCRKIRCWSWWRAFA